MFTSNIVINLIQLVGGLILAVYFMQLIKSFGYMNLSELRRRAQAEQIKAQRVLRARLYGLKLWLILWAMLCLMVVIIISALDILVDNFWLSLLFDIIILIGLLFVLPWAKWPKPDLDLAASASPTLIFVLDKLKVFLRPFAPLKIGQRLNLETPFYIHSKANLVDVVKDLKTKTKNKQILTDLNLTISSLMFGSKKIKTLTTPLTVSKVVNLDDRLSAKFIHKLHDLGFSIFPVKHPQSKEICGVLYFRDIKSLNGQKAMVKDVMRSELYYVAAEASLMMVLDAFLKTSQHLFLVVNQQEKVTGFITISDVLRQYLGQQIVLDFEEYDDRQAVARIVGDDKRRAREVEDAADR